MPLSSARETFGRHGILFLGANGFLGKVTLGLLLDRFPDLHRIYILIRPKRRQSPEERFESEVKGSAPLAEVLAKLDPAVLKEKVRLVPGDVGQPNCGLDDETLEVLSQNVDLVMNCAGLVEFFPPVDDAFASNVDGVENVIAVTRRLKAKLLHVSTCFVCGESDGLVEESEPILGFYPRRKGPADRGFRHDQEIRFMRERIREAYEAEKVTPGSRRPKPLAQRLTDLGWQRALQWGWTNTYTYTKSLGEQLIVSQEDLDYTLVRPAIVEAAVEFPFPGWVEGGRTAAPLVMMAMAGLRHWSIREDAPMEVVPVDLVASSMLIAGHLLLDGRAKPVYHVSTADSNPIYFGPLVRMLHTEYHRRRGSLTPELAVRVLTPEEASERGKRQQRRLSQLQQLTSSARRMVEKAGLPGGSRLRNLAVTFRSAGLRAMIRDQTLELYRPFMHDNRFIFEAENIRSAYAELSAEDRDLLPWKPESIDWRDYWINKEVAGVQKWVGNEARA